MILCGACRRWTYWAGVRCRCLGVSPQRSSEKYRRSWKLAGRMYISKGYTTKGMWATLAPGRMWWWRWVEGRR